MSSRKPDKNTKFHRCRDEIKKDQVFDSKRSKIITNASDVTKSTVEEPRMQFRPEFSTLRNFVHVVTNDPSKFYTNDNTSSNTRATMKNN